MKISYKIVMGFSMAKSLVELEVYQVSASDVIEDNGIFLIMNYGDGYLVHEYMEINTEDSNVMVVLLGILLEKMELQTTVLDASLEKTGFGIEEFTS